MVNTESVDGKRLSAAVFIMDDDAILNVAAIPLSACIIKINLIYGSI